MEEPIFDGIRLDPSQVSARSVDTHWLLAQQSARLSVMRRPAIAPVPTALLEPEIQFSESSTELQGAPSSHSFALIQRDRDLIAIVHDRSTDPSTTLL